MTPKMKMPQGILSKDKDKASSSIKNLYKKPMVIKVNSHYKASSPIGRNNNLLPATQRHHGASTMTGIGPQTSGSFAQSMNNISDNLSQFLKRGSNP